MAYELELKYFAEKEAKKIQRTGTGLTTDTEIHRLFERTLIPLRETGAAFLRKFTSANNVSSIESDTSQYYVDNPMMDNVEYPGRWRAVSVQEGALDVNPARQGVLQVLRLGYLETLLVEVGGTTIDFSEARGQTGKFLGDQPTGDDPSDREAYREIIWPNVSPRHVEQILGELQSSTTFSDIVVDGETLEGEWSFLFASVKHVDDGSVVISAMLAQPNFRLDGYSTWLTHKTVDVIYLWGVEKDQAQGVADAWKAEEGASCTFGYGRELGLVDIILRRRRLPETEFSVGYTSRWDCRYKETVTQYFSLSDPDEHPVSDLPVPGDGVSYRRSISDNGDGTWDITIVTITVQYRDVPTRVSLIAGNRTVNTTQQLGLTTQGRETMSSVAGQITSQEVSVRDDCSSDVTTDRDVGTAQTHTEYRRGKASETDVTEKTVQLTAITKPSAVVGKVITVSNRQSRYADRYDTREETVEVQDQEGNESTASHAQTAAVATHTQNEDEEDEATETSGEIIRVRNSPTEFGLWNTHKETVTAVDQEGNEAAESHAQTAAVETHSQKSTEVIVGDVGEADPETGVETPVEDWELSAGEIIRVRNSPTEFGLWNTHKETVTAVDQEGTGSTASYAQTTAVETHSQKSAEVIVGDVEVLDEETGVETPVEGWELLGKIVRVRNSPTEFGLWDTHRETVTAIDQSGTESTASHAQTTAAATHTQKSEVEEAVTVAVGGAIVRVRNSPTEFGLWNTHKETVTAVDQAGTEETETAFQTVDVDTNTQNDAVAVEETFAEGTIISKRAVPTAFGLEATRKETVTAKPQDWTYDARYSDTRTVEREHGRHAEEIPVITDEDGVNTSLRATMNEFGLYDYEQETETMRVPKSCSAEVTWITYSLYRWRTNTALASTAEVYQRSYTTSLTRYRYEYTHTLFYYLTAAEAAAAITGGYQGSTFSRAGDHLWQAHKIAIAEAGTTSYNFVAPTFVETAGINVPKPA